MMAKKKQKDEEKIDEEFNKDSFEDISDADDSFGLPEVEMEPLSEVDEPEEKKEEATEEEEASTEIVAEEDRPDIEAEAGPEAEDSEEDSYQEPGEFEEGDETETVEQSAETKQTSTYVPPKKESIMPKLLILGAIFIVAGVVVWYFLFYKPGQDRLAEEEKARLEQVAIQKAEEDRLKQEAEDRRLLAEDSARQAALDAEQAALEPELGTITEITERTGRYYVVIGSFIDDDLAKDYGNKLAVEGINTSLISPYSTVKFFRLAVASHESYAEAQANADEIKETYGEALWVLKF